LFNVQSRIVFNPDFLCVETLERNTGDVFLQSRKRRDVLHVVRGERGALAGPKIAGGWIPAGYYQA